MHLKIRIAAQTLMRERMAFMVRQRLVAWNTTGAAATTALQPAIVASRLHIRTDTAASQLLLLQGMAVWSVLLLFDMVANR
jgi:hypothetical protein